MKSKFQKLLAILTGTATVLSLFPGGLQDVHAASVVGSLNGSRYTDFEDMLDDLEDDYEGRSVTIEMFRDWDAEADSDFDERIIIPKNCRAVLNLNGHVFDRHLNYDEDWSFNGELICMESGSSLVVNGGDPNVYHIERVYDSTDGGRESVITELYGGILTGGSSTNGAGGIHINDNCTLVLNNVTLAGCRSECPWYDSAGTRSGYGAGIWIKGGNTSVTMNNSTITGCHSQLDGAGIYASNYNNVTLTLNNSRIDKNYSRDDGGGINLDGEKLTVKGDGKSTVSNNVASDIGGGIYIWNDEVSVSGLIIKNNRARQGGGIYTQEEDIVLSDLEITGNSASDKGGGIFINNDGNILQDCVITGNTNYGVFVESDVDVDFCVNGNTIIKDNGRGNLTLKNSSSLVNFSLSDDADVHFGYEETPSTLTAISNEPTADNRQFLTADRSDYAITYSFLDRFTDDTGKELYTRKHYYANRAYADEFESTIGTELQGKPKQETIAPSDAGNKLVGRVNAGGELNDNGDYALVRAFTRHQITNDTSVNKYNSDSVFYYSDGLFFIDPRVYNDHLATASLNLAYSAMYLRDDGKDPETYKYKHAASRQFLADIGCQDDAIYVNDNYIKKPSTDSIGVIIASKPLLKYDGSSYTDTGYTLVPIAVRGGGYESEWASNMTLGDGGSRDGEAQGFSEAADQVISSLQYYISKYSLEDELAAGKVKFWVTGFSRGGATANLTSKRLIETYCYDANGNALGNEVFSYCNEPPKGGTDKAEKLSDKTCYYSIHNVVNACDVVPLVAPSEMGFKRYGVDHYVPGTQAGEVVSENDLKKLANRSSGIAETVTTYHDNNWLDEKSQKVDDLSNANSSYGQYAVQRGKMNNQLRAVNSNVLFDDLFWPKGLKLNPFTTFTIGGNIGGYLASNRVDFLDDFISFLLQSAVYSRADFAVNRFTLGEKSYSTLQQSLRDIMTIIYTADSDALSTATEKASALIDSFDYLTFSSSVSIRDIYDDVVGDWHTLSDKDKHKYITCFWDRIKATGALDAFSKEEVSRLENDFPVLMNLAFNFIDGDWAAEIDDDYTYPSGKQWINGPVGAYMMYALTFADAATNILLNHTPEVVLAWVRSYDSYYTNETTEYSIAWGSSNVSSPSAYVMADDKKTSLQANNTDANNLIGDKKIYLDVETAKGEAIYYTLEDLQNNTVMEKEQIYRGGIDLKLGDASRKSYKLTSYARSYGSNSQSSTYYVNLLEDRHIVNLVSEKASAEKTGMLFATPEDSDSIQKTYSFREGHTADIVALHSEDTYFISWTVTDENGQDVTQFVLGDTKDSPYVTFTMPLAGTSVDGYTWSDDYTLNFIENSSSKETLLTISSLKAPVEGEALDEKAVITFENGASDATYLVRWTCQTEDGQIAIPSAIAGQNMVYTASVNIPKESNKLQVFGSQEKLSAILENDPERLVSITKNDTDGSVTLSVTFDKTGTTGGWLQQVPSLKLSVVAVDLSANLPMKDVDPSWEDITYLVDPDSKIVLTAPDVEDEGFVGWQIEGNDIYLKEGYFPTDKTVELGVSNPNGPSELTISPAYIPVLNEIHAVIPEPVVGEELPSSASMIVSITHDYEIHPDNLSVTWSPNDPVVNAMTQYTATIHVVGNEEGNILVRHAGSDSDYRNSNLSYIYFPESILADVNGEDAPYDTNEFIMTKTFDPILHSLKDIKEPETIPPLDNSLNSEKGVMESLPSTTKVFLSDGSDETVNIQWHTFSKLSGEEPEDASTWQADGVIILPETVDNPNLIPLDVALMVNVKEMEIVSTPQSTLESGTFLGDQSTTLQTDTEGAEIYYTTDGSDPHENGILYQGEAIEITRENVGHDNFTIRAIASKDGMRTSMEAVYVYDFTYTLSIPVATDGIFNTLSHVGVESGAFFTLVPTSEDVTIDERGNAIATKAGTYQVIAKADEGFAWKTEDGETSEDQVITFTIASLDIQDLAEISVNDFYDTLDELKQDIKVMIGDFELPSEYYTTSFSEGEGDLVTITVTGIGSCSGTVTKTVNVSPGETAVIVFDADGGAFPDGNAKKTMTCRIGQTIRIPEAPEKKGYAFQYWKGSSYKPGDSYTVTGDHTFTAVWKKSKGIGPDTSDSTNISAYTILLFSSAILSVLIMRSLKKLS